MGTNTGCSAKQWEHTLDVLLNSGNKQWMFCPRLTDVVTQFAYVLNIGTRNNNNLKIINLKNDDDDNEDDDDDEEDGN